ncbi:uncharacterized protein LOC132294569 [Cornus florida]|uniref:uncharacterized protein LOC132294569 n=1 Tax=Cornus florida TaxID=4283 RepID=UPI00289BC455|nr:uncharacterized protein LOC132294569 [Cornus florida]
MGEGSPSCTPPMGAGLPHAPITQQTNVHQEQQKPSWRSIFDDDLQKKMEILPYLPECRGAKVVKIMEEDTIEEVEYWKHSIVGYLVGKRSYFYHISDFLKRIWKTAGNFKLISLPKGFFMVRFDDENTILQRIHTYQGRPMILKRWDKNVNLEKEILGSVPIWVQLFNLPMHCTGNMSIARVCSQFSKPLYPDEATLARERGGFVKVMVEVDVHDELPEVVNVDIHGIECEVFIEYDWKPQLCRKCNGYNHSEVKCPRLKIRNHPQNGLSNRKGNWFHMHREKV